MFTGSEPPKYLVILDLTKFLFWFFMTLWNAFSGVFKIWIQERFCDVDTQRDSPFFLIMQKRNSKQNLVKKIFGDSRNFRGSDPANKLVHTKKRSKVSAVLPTINASCIIKKKMRARVLGPTVLHHTWSKKHNYEHILLKYLMHHWQCLR